MLRRLWDKVEEVRKKPEAIRKRYVLACLSVSMVFIVGIWILSLRESVAKARLDRDAAPALLPETGVPSLTELLEKSAPLSVESSPSLTGEDYFNAEMGREPRDTSGLESEGIAPQGN